MYVLVVQDFPAAVQISKHQTFADVPSPFLSESSSLILSCQLISDIELYLLQDLNMRYKQKINCLDSIATLVNDAAKDS